MTKTVREPLEHRILRIPGKVSGNIIKELLCKFALGKSENAIWVFVDYSDYEVSLGTLFEVIFLKDQPEIVEFEKATLGFVTQQFFEEFDGIPKGWKTI